jgi:aldehyde dehydrogenase (NAD+)
MASTLSRTADHLVNGQWRPSNSELRASVNPAHPEEVVVEFGNATAEDVNDAFAAARRALRGWSSTPAPARGRIVRAAAAALALRRDEVAALVCRDTGKTLAEAAGEVDRSVEILYYHAGHATAEIGRSYPSENRDEQISVIRRPRGVIGVITPFNFPLAVAAWKIAPALVHGNTVVWKPADAAPAAGNVLADLLHAAGLPGGVLNLLQGDGSVGAAITAHHELDAITFTGSVPVGQAIARQAAAHDIPAQLELGGHNAALVFSDADLSRAASAVIAGVMPGAGQRCTSTRRVLVTDSVYDRFLPELRAALNQLRVGDGLREQVDLGPVISAHARDHIAAAMDRAVRQGAGRIEGGRYIGETGTGYYVRPTVLTDVLPDMEVAQEEVFGPLCSVMRVADDDDAVGVANATRFGLSAAVFTRDERRIRRLTEELDVGVLHINNATTGAQPHIAFSGRRSSGSPGSPPEQGETARDFYTWTKAVYSEPG